MSISEAISAFESYDWALFLLGLGVLAVSTLPRLLHDKPLNVPPIVIGLGFLAWRLPLGLAPFDPIVEHRVITEHVTEFGVILSLMVAGLSLDRRVTWPGWAAAWRLLGVTMPLTIAGAAVGGWWAGLVPATAVLLGAALAPTDPVLGKDLAVGPAGQGAEAAETETHDPTDAGEEDEVRFALSAEAGLNDGLAFPFTNLAILLVVAGTAPSDWAGTWLVSYVGFKLAVGFVLGVAFGKAFAAVILRLPARSDTSRAMLGLASLAATLLVYGGVEVAGGYGFIATFVAAVTLRQSDRDHGYIEYLETFAEQAERTMLVLVMFFFGGAIATGLLDALTWELALLGIGIVFVLRPVTGLLALVGHDVSPWRDRSAMAFYGIRGVATFYYLAHAIEAAAFTQTSEIWAAAGFTVLLAVVVHGVTAAPVLRELDRRRHGTEHATEHHPHTG